MDLVSAFMQVWQYTAAWELKHSILKDWVWMLTTGWNATAEIPLSYSHEVVKVDYISEIYSELEGKITVKKNACKSIQYQIKWIMQLNFVVLI